MYFLFFFSGRSPLTVLTLPTFHSVPFAFFSPFVSTCIPNSVNSSPSYAVFRSPMFWGESVHL
uniref:Uncharacterized protein n=1 Tax=Anguilla anguilla TaxID=7936 RepID=A0A0E9WF61_ANGAN